MKFTGFLRRTLRAGCVIVLWAVAHATPLEAGEWRRDFSAAEAEARQQKLPMLVHFYADWCNPCRRMDREILESNRLKSLFENGMIAVKVNSDQRPDLVRRFRITALPSDVFLSADGKVVKQSEGYRRGDSYLAQVASFRKEFAVAAQPAAVEPEPSSTELADQSTEQPIFSEDDPDLIPLDKVPVQRPDVFVGLESFSPVSLWNFRQWRRGRPEFAVSYRGISYYLVDAEEVEQFEKNPRQFAPRLLGCDPVILTETDRAIEGSTEYGAYFDGGLYLFSTRASRERFKLDPIRFTRTQHAIRVDDVKRTARRDQPEPDKQ